jgi:hypothetical protein
VQASQYQPFQGRPRRTQTPNRSSLLESLDRQLATLAVQHKAFLYDVCRQPTVPADSSARLFLTEHRIIPYSLFEPTPQFVTYLGKATVFETREPPALFESFEEQRKESAGQYEVVLREVRRHYAFPVDSSVRGFLTEHRTISHILLEAVPHLKACFGDATVFSLRAPMDDAGSRTLYAVAMWPGRPCDVREALARFDDSWWTVRSRRASAYLAFTYELT